MCDMIMVSRFGFFGVGELDVDQMELEIRCSSDRKKRVKIVVNFARIQKLIQRVFSNTLKFTVL